MKESRWSQNNKFDVKKKEQWVRWKGGCGNLPTLLSSIVWISFGKAEKSFIRYPTANNPRFCHRFYRLALRPSTHPNKKDRTWTLFFGIRVTKVAGSFLRKLLPLTPQPFFSRQWLCRRRVYINRKGISGRVLSGNNRVEWVRPARALFLIQGRKYLDWVKDSIQRSAITTLLRSSFRHTKMSTCTCSMSAFFVRISLLIFWAKQKYFLLVTPKCSTFLLKSSMYIV